MKGKLYPTIGVKKAGEHIKVNFGQDDFVFDINKMMRASSAYLPVKWPAPTNYNAAIGRASDYPRSHCADGVRFPMSHIARHGLTIAVSRNLFLPR